VLPKVSMEYVAFSASGPLARQRSLLTLAKPLELTLAANDNYP
jgi:hypothetical protein